MIEREDRGAIAVVRMEHGRAQALDTELLTAIHDTFAGRSSASGRTRSCSPAPAPSSLPASTSTGCSTGARDYLVDFLPALRLGAAPPVRLPAAGGGGGQRPRHRRRLHPRLRLRPQGDGRGRRPHRGAGAARGRALPGGAARGPALRGAAAAPPEDRLLGRTYGARDALSWGLVDELVPPERAARARGRGRRRAGRHPGRLLRGDEGAAAAGRPWSAWTASSPRSTRGWRSCGRGRTCRSTSRSTWRGRSASGAEPPPRSLDKLGTTRRGNPARGRKPASPAAATATSVAGAEWRAGVPRPPGGWERDRGRGG